MTTNMKRAQELIFGNLGASNFKMFPGSNREVTAEMIAKEVAKVVDELGAGELVEIDLAD
ncbi:MAG: hypothetical protein WBG81_07515 [Rhodanobacter sp.]|jgi:hypothetical protein|uniref:hypothetical protein n=1 Tax=Rhodanobacter sp. KK11 TaxID=3083255 RepID=UPI002966A514|nr:hypothetical protein [Rhodanobacter sp. KK11]MDW2979952.1 hypothetical protein [Rhodanobacter sp. KK11]